MIKLCWTVNLYTLLIITNNADASLETKKRNIPTNVSFPALQVQYDESLIRDCV